MKPVLMFMMKSCPYCREALNWMEALKKENASYGDVDISIIDEADHPEIAEKYHYYYVPTYFVDGVKVHEGECSKDIVRSIFEKALG